MKKFSMFLALGMMVAGAFLASCEGPAGKDGLAGEPGEDGVDANATCTQCHNATPLLTAKAAQYANSQHAVGETTFETGTSCAVCHTSEGWLERIASGKFATAAAIQDPSPIGCRTCHKIHQTYEAADWALAATDPVIMVADSTQTLDMGSANICITCHQSRPLNPNLGKVSGDNVSITSSRWGPHHGPQAQMVSGLLGSEIGGGALPTSLHKNAENGCVTCHMASAVGVHAGGHTFKAYDEAEGLNVAGCSSTSCHGSTEPEWETMQANTEARMAALKQAFIDAGYLNATTGLWKATSTAPLVVTKNKAGAMFNWKMVEEDKSLGVHNPKYVNEMLKRAMTEMGVADPVAK